MKTRRIINKILAALLCITICISTGVLSYADTSTKSTNGQVLSMDNKQLSALAMLNYLTVLSQEINASSNSRLYLDNAYSEIENNLNLNAIDSDSMYEIRTLMDTIHNYQSIDTKREHLKYIYEQNQANAIQKALPNPMSVLSVVQSGNWIKALISVTYMAVDAKSSYDSYASEIETRYMQDGWALDQEEKDNLNESSKETLTYMRDMCNKNNIDSNLVLRKDSIESFVKWENNPNITRKVDFFEKNKSTYQGYGKYWLVLAECYYEKGDYKKCLDAVKTYEKMNVDTFEKDKGLAKVAGIAISASREIDSDSDYIKQANHYVDVIKDNIVDDRADDWALRYLAAQTCADLYAKTNDKKYLQKAYEFTELNVNLLLDEQSSKNKAYLADIVEEKAKSNASKEQKKEIKNHNKWLKEEREVELPPVYQPLVVNCELLRGLADKLNIDKNQKEKLDKMLHPNGDRLFLVEPIEELYWFSQDKSASTQDIVYDKGKITIPATQLSLGTTLRVTVTEGGIPQVYDKWELEEVSRDKKDKKNVSKFLATYTNSDIKKQKYSNNSKIKLEIIPAEGSSNKTKTYEFKADTGKALWVFDTVKFEMVK